VTATTRARPGGQAAAVTRDRGEVTRVGPPPGAAEGALRARLSAFDLPSLLDLLGTWGYGPEEIRFVSNYSSASPPQLIHDVEFQREPRLARIAMNIGFLAVQTPMPSYFQKLLDEGRLDAATFVPFLEFLDHAVLSTLVGQLYPERNPQLFPDWDLSRRRDLLLLNLRSCATLTWLFAAVFPELEVNVAKSTLGRDVHTGSLTLGTTTLGSDAVFGTRARLPVPGRQVTLTSDGERAGSGLPWPQEIKTRLAEVIFPILATVGIDLEIALIIAEEASVARLDDASYLGYDRVRGGSDSFRRIRLHSGYVGS
jgi:predicted component of type VI protein secretion system